MYRALKSLFPFTFNTSFVNFEKHHNLLYDQRDFVLWEGFEGVIMN